MNLLWETGVTIRVKPVKSNAYWKALVTGICRKKSTQRDGLQMDLWGREGVGVGVAGEGKDSLVLWFILDLEQVEFKFLRSLAEITPEHCPIIADIVSSK